jgi:hypothetical protein
MTSTEKITEITLKDGVKTTLSERFNKLSSFKRRFIIGYGLLSIVNFGVSSYMDGKNALLTYRKNGFFYENEFDAVSKGCKRRGLDNFIISIVLPYTVISNIVPVIVIKMNPDLKYPDPKSNK